MKVAVAKRPVEPFETEVTLPEWQLEPDAEAYYGSPDNGVDDGMMVDENGLPIERARPAQPDPRDDQDMEVDPQDRLSSQRIDQQWIDNVLGRDRQRQPPPRPAPGP